METGKTIRITERPAIPIEAPIEEPTRVMPEWLDPNAPGWAPYAPEKEREREPLKVGYRTGS